MFLSQFFFFIMTHPLSEVYVPNLRVLLNLHMTCLKVRCGGGDGVERHFSVSLLANNLVFHIGPTWFYRLAQAEQILSLILLFTNMTLLLIKLTAVRRCYFR